MPRCTMLFFIVLFSLAAALSAAETAAAAQPGCGQALDLAALLAAKAEMSPAPVLPLNPAPELMAKPPRHGYCKCGCGVGCTTDADCGPGGQCVAFITCC